MIAYRQYNLDGMGKYARFGCGVHRLFSIEGRAHATLYSLPRRRALKLSLKEHSLLSRRDITEIDWPRLHAMFGAQSKQTATERRIHAFVLENAERPVPGKPEQ